MDPKNIIHNLTYSPWFYLLLCIVIFILVSKFNVSTSEGFHQASEFVYLKECSKIYDTFYSEIYDDLFYTPYRAKTDTDDIVKITKLSNNSTILDVGSGTGSHIKEFILQGANVYGIDISPQMSKVAKRTNPSANIKVSDVTNAIAYPSDTFTHISCLYFTIYYIQDKHQFFLNAYDWLEKDGFLIIHLVNRDMFDPILPAANPLYMVSPQKYAKERITNSGIKFKDFEYKSQFFTDKDSNSAIFEETFKDDLSGHIRKQQHKLYMNTQKDIIQLAKKSGFNVVHKTDLVNTQYEYQYLYYLQK
jgi:SAM-dependent methyltransferase|tara:strand:+ start:1846 stop:2757 length:912 start_codon:yes stop_codon:yes gene_type:complete